MSSERRGGGGGLGAAFVLLIFVGAIVNFWVWIVAVLGAIVLFVLLWWLASRAADRAAEQDAERDAVVARADAQHKQIMAGDDRGIYGAYPPAVPPAPEPRPPAGERGRAQLTGLDAFVDGLPALRNILGG
jgi:hypothetical protein